MRTYSKKIRKKANLSITWISDMLEKNGEKRVQRGLLLEPVRLPSSKEWYALQ